LLAQVFACAVPLNRVPATAPFLLVQAAPAGAGVAAQPATGAAGWRTEAEDAADPQLAGASGVGVAAGTGVVAGTGDEPPASAGTAPAAGEAAGPRPAPAGGSGAVGGAG